MREKDAAKKGAAVESDGGGSRIANEADRLYASRRLETNVSPASA